MCLKTSAAKNAALHINAADFRFRSHAPRTLRGRSRTRRFVLIFPVTDATSLHARMTAVPRVVPTNA